MQVLLGQDDGACGWLYLNACCPALWCYSSFRLHSVFDTIYLAGNRPRSLIFWWQYSRCVKRLSIDKTLACTFPHNAAHYAAVEGCGAITTLRSTPWSAAGFHHYIRILNRQRSSKDAPTAQQWKAGSCGAAVAPRRASLSAIIA